MNKAKVNALTIGAYIIFHGDDLVGKDGFTVSEEFQRIFGAINKLESKRLLVNAATNPTTIDGTSNDGARILSEADKLSDEEVRELVESTRILSQKIAKKITWLSMCCKKACKYSFIDTYINIYSEDSCNALIDSMKYWQDSLYLS